MMLDDLDYVESITNMIETQQVNARLHDFLGQLQKRDVAFLKVLILLG